MTKHLDELNIQVSTKPASAGTRFISFKVPTRRFAGAQETAGARLQAGLPPLFRDLRPAGVSPLFQSLTL
jgi:hypothetical protein